MASQYRVLFAGGVLEGFDKDTVKRAAGARLKLSSTQLDTIFSGQKIILKKGLGAEEASRYGSALEKIGMRIRVQKVVTEAVAEPTQVDAKPALEAWPPVDDNLPRGGIGQRTAAAPAPQAAPEPEYDPEKTHIYSPGAHAQMYAEPSPVAPPHPTPPPRALNTSPAATTKTATPAELPPPLVEKIIAKAPEPDPVISTNELPVAASASVATAQLRDAKSIQDAPAMAEDPPLLGIGSSGRLGRVGFLIGGLVVKSAIILLVLIGASLGKVGLISALVIAGLPGLYFLLRLVVLRLHDLGADGRLCVLAFIPGVNVIAALFWIFFPGNRASNRYGAPGSTAGAVPVLITIAVFACIVAGAVWLFPRNLLPFLGQ